MNENQTTKDRVAAVAVALLLFAIMAGLLFVAVAQLIIAVEGS